MNALTLILQKMREGKLPADPIPLDTANMARFSSWLAGFDAQTNGYPMDPCPLAPQSRRLWREGWNASARVEQLKSEPELTVADE